MHHVVLSLRRADTKLENNTILLDILGSGKVTKTTRIIGTHGSCYKSKYAIGLVCAFVGLQAP